MPYDDNSLLGGLAPQREGLGGLLGSLDSKMPYLAMIAKGLNPWSELDPMAMMKLAQAEKEHKIQLAMARQRLAHDQQRLGFEERGVNLRESEAEYKRKQAEAEDQAAAGVYKDLYSIPKNAAPSAGTMATPEAPPAPGVPPAPTPPALRVGSGMTLDYVNEKLADKNVQGTTRQWLMKQRERLEEGGKLERDNAQREAIADKMGLEGAQRQGYILNGKLPDQEKPLPGEAAGRLALADSFLRKAPAIEKEIREGNLSGPIDTFMARNGIGQKGVVHGDIQSGVDALRRMLTGAGMPQSEADEYTQRYLPSYKDTSATLLKKHERLVEELTGMRDNIMRGRGSAPSPSSVGQTSPATDLKKKYGLE